MPNEWERRSKAHGWGDWGPSPARSQQRAAAAKDDPVTPQRKAKKGPEHCPGSPDRQHHGEILFGEQYFKLRIFGYPTGGECGWGITWHPDWPAYRDYVAAWKCLHASVCRQCGKILCAPLSPRECPDYREDPGEMEAAREWAAERTRQAEAARAAYRPRNVPSGKQGYRKKKNE